MLLCQRQWNTPTASVDAGAESVVEHVRHRDFVGHVQLTVGVVGVPIELYVGAKSISGRGVDEPRRIGLEVEGKTSGGPTTARSDGERIKVRRVIAHGKSPGRHEERVERAAAGRPGSDKPELGGEGQILKAAHIIEHALTGVRPDIREGRNETEAVGYPITNH